ncbi:MAG TPA: NADH-quinone oxidoreductase subunit H [Candidatus Omnitrophota bacterium]|nr:NADH-quinone oxidoreductase subunit H [Candidatus Omnitrophota bacterium]HPD84898.1 NADH-quinone oxidoreductase subunit H [Candidatus Omnitrophota bacterium]HRZ03756.1 NADH-quinone oxidoreductase subunit H [Candidatus Omnitrophota bacterium]
MSDILYLIIYGFVVTALVGFLASWFERKITARLQYRVGPPLLQPVYDIVKLLGKETLVPFGVSKATFLSAPLLGLASVALVSTLLWVNTLNPGKTFIGDLVVVLYLLTIPSMSMMIGGFASRNPLASLGASREMKLILSYELPFLLAVFVPVIKGGFSIKLGELLSFQAQNGVFGGGASGVLAFVVAILCVQAKIGFVPFDVAEAETEISGGLLIEYSGSSLAIFKVMKNMLLCTLPLFLIVIFFGGLRFDGINALYSLLKYIGILFLIIVIKNTNPRVRIDHAVRFFWGPVMVLAILAVVLAFKGL